MSKYEIPELPLKFDLEDKALLIFIQIAPDVHSKTAFAIHISTVMQSKTSFSLHEASVMYKKTQFPLHENGDLL